MHPNARRQHETLDQYHRRLATERNELKARLKGTMVWQSTSIRVEDSVFAGKGTYRKAA